MRAPVFGGKMSRTCGSFSIPLVKFMPSRPAMAVVEAMPSVPMESRMLKRMMRLRCRSMETRASSLVDATDARSSA